MVVSRYPDTPSWHQMTALEHPLSSQSDCGLASLWFFETNTLAKERYLVCLSSQGNFDKHISPPWDQKPRKLVGRLEPDLDKAAQTVAGAR